MDVSTHLLDERLGLVTLLLIGYNIATSSLITHALEAGTLGAKVVPWEDLTIPWKYTRCMLIIAISFMTMLLYFRGGEVITKEGKHALRVSNLRGIFWIFLHMPLIFALVVQGSTSILFITMDTPTDFIRALFGYSVGAVFIISALLQSLHKGAGKKKVTKRGRMLARWLTGLLILAIGYFPAELHPSPLIPLGLTLFAATCGIIFDLWGSTDSRIAPVPMHARVIMNGVSDEESWE